MAAVAPSAVARATRRAEARAGSSPGIPRADQEAHDQPEVVAGDAHGVALLQVPAAAQPGPGQREAALDRPGPEPGRLPGRTRAQPGAVVVDGPTRLPVAAPAARPRRLP